MFIPTSTRTCFSQPVYSYFRSYVFFPACLFLLPPVEKPLIQDTKSPVSKRHPELTDTDPVPLAFLFSPSACIEWVKFLFSIQHFQANNPATSGAKVLCHNPTPLNQAYLMCISRIEPEALWLWWREGNKRPIDGTGKRLAERYGYGGTIMLTRLLRSRVSSCLMALANG